MIYGILDRGGRQKLYSQLSDMIREQIQSGEIKEGQLLPTEDSLCKNFSVSKAVVRQAMTELAREGYVQKRQGIGTFASKPRNVEGPLMTCALTDRVLDFGRALETIVIHKSPSVVPSEMQRLFNNNAPDQVFKLIRLKRVKSEPVLLETAYVVTTYCPGLALDDLKNQSLFELIETRYRLRVHRVATCLDITPLGQREAELLQSQPGRPALLMDQVIYISEEQVLALVRSICPQGSHRLTFEYQRRI
jgi:GntR family transcriptional regulator